MDGDGIRKKTSLQQHNEDRAKIVKYAMIVAALVIVAAAFYLIPKSGSTNCSSILIGQSQDNCILALAISTQNATLCSSLPSQNAQECYVEIAQSTGRYQLCGNVSSYNREGADQCYMYFANKTDNANICGYVTSPDNYQCLFKIAINTRNASYCHGIHNSTQLLICNDSIALSRNLAGANAGYCAALNGTYNGTDVLGLIGNVKVKSGSSLGNTAADSMYFSAYPNFTYSKSDICYYFFSTLGGRSYCQDINGTIVKYLCRSSFGQGFNFTSSINVTNNSTGINSSTSSNYTSLLAQCSLAGNFSSMCTTSALLSKALQTRNASICSQLPALVSTECFDSLASKYQNETYCSYIGNSSQKYSCILGVYGNYSVG